MAPILAFGSLRATWQRESSPDPAKTIAFYCGAATGVAALYFAVEILAVSARGLPGRDAGVLSGAVASVP